MLNEVYDSFKEESNSSLEALKKSLDKLRTGRANSAMLNDIRVDYYGSLTPISQMANIMVPEARLLAIKPWDKSTLKLIEKAIIASDLGINPSNNGEQILLSIPALTEERRRDLVKKAKKMSETIKISLRSHRHDALDMLKELEKDKEITEDDHKMGKIKIQDMINAYNKKVDTIISEKEKEIMKV